MIEANAIGHATFVALIRLMIGTIAIMEIIKMKIELPRCDVAFVNRDWGMFVTVSKYGNRFKIHVKSGDNVKEHFEDTLEAAIAKARIIVGG